MTSRAPPTWISTQTTGDHVVWRKYAVTFWKSTAIHPLVAAAQPMAKFYQQATSAAIEAMLAQSETNSYTFALGALRLYADTLDGSPIDWNMMMLFAGNMVGAARMGWTSRYSALVKDTVTGVLTVVTLEVAGGVAKMWLGGGTDLGQIGTDPFGNKW